MRRIIFWLSLIPLAIGVLIPYYVFGQQMCGTEISESFKEMQRRSIPGYFGCEQINRTDRTLSVLFQVVEDSLGSTGISDATLDAAIARLNEVWSTIGISFEFCERRDLPNHQFNFFREIDHDAEMKAMYYEPNIINIFISSSIELNAFGDVGGYASFPGGADIAHVTKASMGNPEFDVLVHEMGHFFGLYHTFETDLGEELVDGSNCTTAGDLVCDTEANPTDDFDDFIADVNCNYTGAPATDTNGDFYVPPSKNHMSYSPCSCEFTQQQYNRMLEQYQNNRNYLW